MPLVAAEEAARMLVFDWPDALFIGVCLELQNRYGIFAVQTDVGQGGRKAQKIHRLQLSSQSPERSAQRKDLH
jgi:hypothetical protein